MKPSDPDGPHTVRLIKRTPDVIDGFPGLNVSRETGIVASRLEPNASPLVETLLAD
jgi:hypothetical protein